MNSFRLCLAILIIAFSTNSMANNKNNAIRVEFLAFGYDNFDISTYEEDITQDHPILKSHNSINIDQDFNNSEIVKSQEILNLKKQANKIDSSNNFQLYERLSWVQLSANSYQVYFKRPHSSYDNESDATYSISGKVKIKPISRSLNQLTIDVRLKKSDNEPEYRIYKNLKIKSNEAAYFDHPAFGLFLHISPASLEPKADPVEQNLEPTEQS